MLVSDVGGLGAVVVVRVLEVKVVEVCVAVVVVVPPFSAPF